MDIIAHQTDCNAQNGKVMSGIYDNVVHIVVFRFQAYGIAVFKKSFQGNFVVVYHSGDYLTVVSGRLFANENSIAVQNTDVYHGSAFDSKHKQVAGSIEKF